MGGHGEGGAAEERSSVVVRRVCVCVCGVRIIEPSGVVAVVSSHFLVYPLSYVYREKDSEAKEANQLMKSWSSGKDRVPAFLR